MISFAAHRSPRNQRAARGFTLIELMITVAIIGILARIGLPSYLEYVKRGKLTEAFNQMTASALAYGQYFQDNRLYDATHNTPAGPTPPCPTSTPNFNYSCAYNTTYTTYTITASGSTSATTGFAFTLTDQGLRATTSTPSGSGWPTNTQCWVSSKSGSCY